MTEQRRTLQWISVQIDTIEAEFAKYPVDSQNVLVNQSRLDVLIRIASQMRTNPDPEQWLLDEIGRTDQIVMKIGSASSGAWDATLDALVDSYNVYKDIKVA